jgi:hypothetical protein
MCLCNKRRVVPGPGLAPGPAPRLQPAAVAVDVPAVVALATVDTAVWGAALWLVLHTASVTVTDRSQIAAWQNVLEALRTGIPCPDCSAHYNDWYNSHPLKFSIVAPKRLMNPMARARRTAPAPVQATTVGWMLDLHNNVNQRLGKPGWSFDQVVSAYGSTAAAAAATLQTLRGVIGDNLLNALTVFIH